MNKVWLYYPASMSFFGDRACALFGWERFYPIDSKRIKGANHTVIFWLYHPDDYMIFRNSQVTKRVYWHGSDVYLAINPEMSKILRSVPAMHACQSEQQKYILELAGITPEIKPFFFGDIARYKPDASKAHYPIEDIYINVNQGREEEYGILPFLRAAKELPTKRFHVFGIDEFIPFDNVVYYGRVSEERYDQITDDFDLYCMLHRNAGTSQSAIKAVLRGQYVVSSNLLSFHASPIFNWMDLISYVSYSSAEKHPKNLILNDLSWI